MQQNETLLLLPLLLLPPPHMTSPGLAQSGARRENIWEQQGEQESERERPERAGFSSVHAGAPFSFPFSLLSNGLAARLDEMRGLVSFYRGLHALTSRQTRRKAGILGSRCGFCGTQSNSKVRLIFVWFCFAFLCFELLSRKRSLFTNTTICYFWGMGYNLPARCCMQLWQM